MPKAIITYRWVKRPKENNKKFLVLVVCGIAMGWIEGNYGAYEAFTMCNASGAAKKRAGYHPMPFRTQREAKKVCEEYHGFARLDMQIVYGAPRAEYC